MFYSKGFSVEVWFQAQMENLRLVDYTPIALATVIRVVRQHLPSKAVTGESYINNPKSVDEWMDKILKIDIILRVEQADGTIQRVAVDVSANASKARSKFDEIRQSNFGTARRELRLDRHWVVLVNEQKLPSPDDLTDAIYEVVDSDQKCVIIDLWEA